MTIEGYRNQIDRIDDEILRLLNERVGLALKILRLKNTAGLPVCNVARERSVLSRLRLVNKGPLDERAITGIFQHIIRESRKVQTHYIEMSEEPPKS